jgi:malonyl-CoA/methylmalonyl-CoA synthetase
MEAHLYQTLLRGFSKRDAVAFETADGTSLTYGDLDRESARMANAMISMGVQPGDRVAVQVEKSIMAVLVYLGVVRAGGVFLPLNTAYTPAEIAYFTGDAEPRIFVCDPAKRDALSAAIDKSIRVETLAADGSGSIADLAKKAPDEFSGVSRGPDDLAAILYTSGTTGRSKGAMLSQDNLASNGRTLVDVWRFTSADTLVHALPIYHTHGLFVAINTLLLAGGRMIFLPRFDADEVMRQIPRATTMMGVPTFYTRLLAHPHLDRKHVAHMRLFISGSAPLLAETHREWQAKTGHAILERYGMTETNMNTSNPYEGDRIPGTVGFPLPGVDLRIADPTAGTILPQGDIGVIEVRGPNVFRGYWRMEEKTRAEFRPDGFFISGDLGRIDERGYVHIVGRGKDLVITGGFNVYPKEVETEIDAMPGVVESAVIGIPHPDFGEGVTAVVVREQNSDLDEGLVIAALESRLAKFKQPKRVLFVEDLPRNAMGKVQKNILRDQYGALYTRD